MSSLILRKVYLRDLVSISEGGRRNLVFTCGKYGACGIFVWFRLCGLVKVSIVQPSSRVSWPEIDDINPISLSVVDAKLEVQDTDDI